MSSLVLEQIRINHELSELSEQAICKELDLKPNGVSIFLNILTDRLMLFICFR
jgi:hypothetical protein